MVQLHVDHIVPVVKGGTNDLANLVTACVPCNIGKGSTDLKAQLPKLPIGQGYAALKCPFESGWPFDIEDPVFCRHGDWVVTEYGLESLSCYYPIEKSRLAETRPGSSHLGGGVLSDWICHLAEKDWATEHFEDFVNAFRDAIRIHGVKATFDMDASLSEAAREIRIGKMELRP